MVTYGTVVGANNRCWLDRNLGAAYLSGAGDLFQWGRGDDGHQTRTSGTTTTLSTTDTPGHGNFILAPNNPYDWRSPQNSNLWQGNDSINNPCPCGFRLPTIAEWETERQSWISNDIAGASASPLKLVVTNIRHYLSGNIQVLGIGYYWASDFSGYQSSVLMIGSSMAVSTINLRAYGSAVRCIKD